VESLAENFTVASSTNITTGTSKTNIAEQLGLEATDTLDFTIETNYGPKRFIFGDTTEIQDASKIVVNKTLDQISLNDIVTSINSAKVTVDGKEVALGVKAVYDSSIDRFFLQTTATGAENWMKITDNSSLNFIAGDANKLNLNIKNYDAIDPTTTYTGKNAVIDFAGATGIIQKSNQFTINGINFDLKATGDFTVRVDNNVDGVYEKISNFVEKYNELVEKNSSLLTEKQYRSYKPLSEDEKKDMKDKDVELWEERAKSGLLRNDMTISRTMQDIRRGMYDSVVGVSGSFDQLTEIGITTEKYSMGSAGGKLTIDEDKLRQAITQDSDGVLELLFKEASGDLATKSESDLTAAEVNQKREESGLVNRLFDNMISGMKGVINKAGSGDDSNLLRNVKSNILLDFVTEQGSISLIDKDILNVNKRLDNMSDYLMRREEQYYSKFTAMEKALQQMNSQSSWLAQQFGG